MFYIVPVRMPFLLGDIGVVSPLAVGASIAATTVSSIPASLSYGWMRARFHPITIACISFMFMAAGYTMVGLSSGLFGVLDGTVAAGVGLGLLMPNAMSWLMMDMPDQRRGQASGILTMALFGGQLMSPLIVGVVVGIFHISNHTLFALFAAMLLITPIIVSAIKLANRPIS